MIRSFSLLAALFAVPAVAAINPDGSYSHQLTIALPPGTGGHQPSLSLSYHSSGGDSLFGYGWRLEGLPSIKRLARPGVQGLSFDELDLFVSHEGPLVARGVPASWYAQRDDHGLYTPSGTCGGGPCSWKLEDRRGNTWEFGLTAADRLMGPNSTVVQWGISRVTNPRGLSWEVTWHEQTSRTGGQLMPRRVTYTMGPGLSTFRTVDFVYDFRRLGGGRLDEPTSYAQRIKQQLTLRVARIEVRTAEVRVRAYRLAYRQGAEVHRSMLESFTEEGNDGTSTLPAVRFEYGALDGAFTIAGYSGLRDLTTRWTGLSVADWDDANHRAVPGDFDGDGLTDVLLQGLSLSLGSGTRSWLLRAASPTPVDLGLGDVWGTTEHLAFPGEFNGDGITDVLLIATTPTDQTLLKYGRRDGSGFDSAPAADLLANGMSWTRWALTSGGAYSVPLLGDFDGDGLTDVLLHSNDDTLKPSLLRFGDGHVGGPSLLDSELQTATAADFNGDGITDLLMRGRAAGTATHLFLFSRVGSSQTQLVSGSGGIFATQWMSAAYDVVPFDLNGDGLNDLLFRPKDDGERSHLALSTGVRFNSQPSIDLDLDQADRAVPLDWNGDGLMDLLVVQTGTGAGNARHRLFRSTGETLELVTDTTLPLKPHSLLPLVATGDARTDVLFLSNDGAAQWDSPSSATGLMVRSENGTGGSSTLTWTPAHEHQGAIVLASAGPGQPNVGARLLATRITTASGVAGEEYTSHFAYGDGRVLVELAGLRPLLRVDLGFARFIEADAQTGQSRETDYRQDVPFAAQVAEMRRYDANKRLMEVQRNEGLVNAACRWWTCDAGSQRLRGKEVVAARPITLVTETFEAGRRLLVQQRTFVYDDFGNPTQAFERASRDDGTVVRERTELNDWINQLAPRRVIGHPWRTRRCLNQACVSALEGVQTTWDGVADGGTVDALLATKVERTQGGAGGGWVPTTRTFDAWGNVLTERGPDGLTTTLEYDQTYHRDRTSEQKPGEPARHFTVDARTGLVLVEQDANGVTTLVEVDPFGRPFRKKWLDAEGAMVRLRTFDVQVEPPAMGSWRQTRTCDVRSGGGETERVCTTVFIDGLGRTRRTEAAGPDGAVAVETLYDTAGRAWKTSEPFAGGTAATAFTVTEYDAAGRVARVTDPSGAITFTRHNQSAPVREAIKTATVIKPGGVSKLTHEDLDGHVLRVTDGQREGVSAGERIDSHYDARGRLERIESPGKVTRFEYDGYGRKTLIEEPDTGITRYTYDDGAFGRPSWGRLARLERPDPNGGPTPMSTTYEYDAAGRLERELAADGSEVTYTWDDPSLRYALGRLARVVQTSDEVTVQTTYAYDATGNRTRVHRSVRGPGWSFAGGEGASYDSLGRLSTLTYPDESVATYRYHPGTRTASELSLDGVVFARWNGYSVRGQVGTLAFGNGVTTEYGYRQDTGALTDAHVSKDGVGLVDTAYAFDRAGQVQSITDRLDPARSRRFEYDDFGRLTHAREGETCPGADCRDFAYGWDSAGNLTGKEGVPFTYEGGRLVQAGARSLGWSASGNLVSSNATTYRYDRRNMLSRIEQAGTFVQQNVHDQDGRRVAKVRLEGPLTTQRTFFMGRLAEVTERRVGDRLTSTRQTKFLIGPDGAVLATVTNDLAAGVRAPTFPGSLGALHFESQMANPHHWRGVLSGLSAFARTAVADGSLARVVLGLVLALAALAAAWVLARQLTSPAVRGGGLGRLGVAPMAFVLFATSACGPQPPPDEPEAFTSQLPPGTHFFHADHLGSVGLVTDAAGAVVTRMRYRPFGDLDTGSGQDEAVTRRFTGQRFDSESGLYHYQARYYDPSLGRFTTADTLVPDSTVVLGFNRYAYANDNPIRYADPSGHSWVDTASRAVFAATGVKLDAITVLTLMVNIVCAALAPFTGGATLFVALAFNTSMGVMQGIMTGSPEMVVASLASGGLQVFGVPLSLGWNPTDGWSVALTVPLLSSGAFSLGASVSWTQNGGFDAGLAFGSKTLQATASYSQQHGASVGARARAGSFSADLSYSSTGASSFGARYDDGNLHVDAGFRTDKGAFLGVSTGTSVDTGLGELSFRSSLRASWDRNGNTSLDVSASHAALEAADSPSYTSMLLQMAAEPALSGQRLELELL